MIQDKKKGAELTIKKKKKIEVMEIYVGEDKMLLAKLVKDQVRYLSMPTPQKYIMTRKGRGGLVLEYVETNYVIGRLNAAFMFNWDSEILEQIVDKENDQIAMKVRLTARFADKREVRKDAWGGSDIKRLKESKKMVDFADDLKSAESDGIKKAASMIGICWDVYSGLTPSGKKTKDTKRGEKSNGLTEAPGAPDRENQFRTIPIKIGSKTYLHTKYEVLDRFKEAKKKLGEELYYKTLGGHGYEKSDQIPREDIQTLYDAMVETYKTAKTKKIEPTKEEPEVIDAADVTVTPFEQEKKETGILSEKEREEIIAKGTPAEEKESTGFSTDEVEKESELESTGEELEKIPVAFPEEKEISTEKKETAEPEMPLQSELMELTKLEITLVDKHDFTPSQIIDQLMKMFNKSEGLKLTRKETLEAIDYFKKVIDSLNSESPDVIEFKRTGEDEEK